MAYLIELERGARRRIVARFAEYAPAVGRLWRRIGWRIIHRGRSRLAARLLFEGPTGRRIIARLSPTPPPRAHRREA